MAKSPGIEPHLYQTASPDEAQQGWAAWRRMERLDRDDHQWMRAEHRLWQALIFLQRNEGMTWEQAADACRVPRDVAKTVLRLS